MKVHIILNSHLDPAWLWNKEQGMDEVVATARTACDLLNDYPEIFITRGEAWFYEVLEFCAPDIYERVKKHVASGRWQVVGNWYIQPDCNQPSPESFAMQAEVSRDIFARLGARPTVGYNVDSFGHAATLPDFYRACGVDSYIMMRPSTREMPLPGHLFLWESPGGSRIAVARLKRYQTTGAPENLPDTIDVALTTATPGIDHCLCFVGVGDHGGAHDNEGGFFLDCIALNRNVECGRTILRYNISLNDGRGIGIYNRDFVVEYYGNLFYFDHPMQICVYGTPTYYVFHHNIFDWPGDPTDPDWNKAHFEKNLTGIDSVPGLREALEELKEDPKKAREVMSRYLCPLLSR
ncbi:MAG: hypothetical protein IJI38_07710 [Clostridia bacterium]|nr:hypothetical protein [Clostridia bacterium]